MTTTNGYSGRRGRRVMICVRGDCAPATKGHQIEARLQQLIQEHGLDDPDHPHHVRCTVTNCLAVCMEGPIMMVHPDGIRYKHLDEAALQRIFQQHFLQDQPVPELMHDQFSRSVLAKREATSRARPRRRRGKF